MSVVFNSKNTFYVNCNKSDERARNRKLQVGVKQLYFYNQEKIFDLKN